MYRTMAKQIQTHALRQSTKFLATRQLTFLKIVGFCTLDGNQNLSFSSKIPYPNPFQYDLSSSPKQRCLP